MAQTMPLVLLCANDKRVILDFGHVVDGHEGQLEKGIGRTRQDVQLDRQQRPQWNYILPPLASARRAFSLTYYIER